MTIKVKENAIIQFAEMIKKSWTYERLTEEEKKRLIIIIDKADKRKVITGSYEKRWNILNVIYETFLMGLGYTGYEWREKENENN